MKTLTIQLMAVLFLVAVTFTWAHAETPAVSQDCPCYGSISRLLETYLQDKDFKALVDAAFKNMQKLPPNYAYENPWMGKDITYLAKELEKWCEFLPDIDGSHDNGLEYIQKFAWFYYQNPYGVSLVQLPPGRKILQDFVRERGTYMDSRASTAKIKDWVKDPRVEIEDYNLPDPEAPDGGFKSFNDFFTRTLKDQAKSRPQTMPDRDYVITAPTDCTMNTIPQLIEDVNTPITTKGNQSLNIVELLDGSPYAEKFIGGTALSCVLMPNTYHHYHAPVGGRVVESKIVKDAMFGYDNFPKWVPQDGNVGYYGSDFSQFEKFQRGYFIIDTGSYGHVAMVAVGLNTISSVVFNEKYEKVVQPVPVKRGEELGCFRYGGSLFIMIFEPKRYQSGAIKVRLGNQIGIFDTGAAME